MQVLPKHGPYLRSSQVGGGSLRYAEDSSSSIVLSLPTDA